MPEGSCRGTHQHYKTARSRQKKPEQKGRQCTDLYFSSLSFRLLVAPFITQIQPEAESKKLRVIPIGLSPVRDRTGRKTWRMAGRSQMENNLQKCQIRFSCWGKKESINSLEIFSGAILILTVHDSLKYRIEICSSSLNFSFLCFERNHLGKV